MTLISGKLLATIAAVLVSVLAALAAYSTNVNVSVGPAEEAFGAVPVLTSPMEVDGTKIYAKGIPAAASSATCVIPGPKLASSTIMGVGAHFRTLGGGGTMGMIEIGVSSTAGATTTRLAYIDSVSSGARSIAATSSLASFASIAGTAGVLPPNSFINVRVATTTGLNGRCSAVLMQLD